MIDDTEATSIILTLSFLQIQMQTQEHGLFLKPCDSFF